MRSVGAGEGGCGFEGGGIGRLGSRGGLRLVRDLLCLNLESLSLESKVESEREPERKERSSSHRHPRFLPSTAVNPPLNQSRFPPRPDSQNRYTPPPSPPN
jgi:hypothetical protein